MKVLVTDGENRSALAVTRSLGRKGHSVFVTGVDKRNIANSSKYCARAFFVPDPLVDSAEYSGRILEIVRKEGIDIVFPMTEQSIYSLNMVRDNFGPGTIMACALADKMHEVSNKFSLFKMAERLSVPIPRTIYVDGYDDFHNNISSQVSEFPVVVKPAYSKIIDGESIISTGVMYATDAKELRRLYETKQALRHQSMIQEVITGEGTGLFTLFDRDRHLALFSHRRILEKPPSGGVSVLSESAPLDDEMVDSAGRLLSEVGWQGVAMVEFKRDNRDGRAKLMEINGRFWGSLQLAVDSGVDFPALFLDYNMGKKPASPLRDYRVGQRLKWFFGVLDHLSIRIKKWNQMRNLPPGTLGITSVLAALLSFGDRKLSSDVYDPDDMKAFITEAREYFLDIIGLKK